MAIPVQLEIFMKDLTKTGLQSVGKNVDDVESRTRQLISALNRVIAEQKRQLDANKAAGLSYTQEAANIQALTGQVRGLEAGLKELRKAQDETSANPTKIDIDTEAVTRKSNNLKMQFSQVARELPSLAMGPQMFILAISNNLPMLADAIADVRRQNDLLAASGEKGVPVWKQMAGALFSWQTGLIAAISLGIVYGKDISKWVSSLFKAKQEALSLADAQKKVNEEFQSADSDIGKQIVTVMSLSDRWKALGDNMDAKKKFIRDNREELDRLGVSVENVTDAENLLAKNTSAYIEAMSLRSQAAAAFKLAEEQAEKAVKKRAEGDREEKKGVGIVDRIKSYWMAGIMGAEGAGMGNAPKPEDYFKARVDGIREEQKVAEESSKQLTGIYTDLQKKADGLLNKSGIKSSKDPKEKHDYTSELLDARVRAQQTTEKLRLQIMQEGAAKRKAAARQEYEEAVADIDRQERDTLARMDKARKQGDNIPQTQYDEVKDTAKTNRLLAEQVYNEQIFQIEKEYRDKSSQALIDYYKEYGTWQDKRLATAKDYARRIAEAETEGQRMALEKQRDAKLREIDFDELKDGMDWEKVFGDLDRVSTGTLESLRGKLKEYLAGISEEISPESYKEVMDAFEKLDAELADRSPFEALKSGYADYIEATGEVRAAQALLQQAQVGGSVIVEEYDEATGELTRKLVTQAEAERMLAAAQDKRAGAQKTLTQAVNSIGQKGEAVVNAGSDIVDMLTSLGVEVPEAMQDVLGGLGTVTSSLASIDFTKPFSILTGITGTLKGIGQTIGGLFGLGHNGTARYEKLREQLEAMNELYDKILGKEKESITFGGGFAALDAADKANRVLEAQLDNYRQLARAASGAGAGLFKHSYGYRTNEAVGTSGYREISRLISKNIDDVSDLFSLTGDELYAVMSQLPDVWNKIDGNIRQYLEDIVELKDETSEIQDALNEALTGVSRDSFYNNFIDQLADMETSFEDLCDGFEDDLRKSILAGLVSSEYDKRIKDLYNKWAEAAKDNDIDEREAERLRNEYQQIVQDLMKQRDEMAEAFGWQSEASAGSSQSPDSGALTTMSQDSISRFEGIGRSLQTHLAGTERIVQEIRDTQRQDSESLSRIVENTSHLLPIRELLEKMERDGIKIQ
nr:MAG TPA: tail tape measure protein [Caudoviricetes sp.]